MLTAPGHGPAPDHADAPRPAWPGLGARREPTRLLRLTDAVAAHPHPIITVLVTVYAAIYIPTWRSGLNLLGSSRAMFVLVTLALAIMLAVPRRWWLVRAAVPPLVAAISYKQGEGEVFTVWVLLALVSVPWAVADRPPLPLRKRVAPGADVLVGILTYTAVHAFSLEVSWQPLAVLAVGPVLMLLTTGRRPSVGRWLDEAAAIAERVAIRLVLAIPALFWLLVHLVGRAFVRDRTAGWARVDEQLADPRRGRRPEKRDVRRGWAPAMSAVAMVAVAALTLRLVVPVLWAYYNGRSIKDSSAQKLGVAAPDDPIPAAYTGAAWYPEFREDMAWVTDERVAWRPLTVQRVLDVETPTVNVHDRVRDSWKAPKCSCTRVTVWLYGGSGAFGLGQRDAHTIASELARLAAADDVVLDVQNRGIPGQMHWRNSTRFAWDLSVEPKPDLVVFYEGAEEVESEMELRARGLADIRAPFESFATNLYEEVVGAPKGPPATPDGVTYKGWPQLDADPGPPGQLAATRYDRSLLMSDRTAKAYKVPVRYFWQPSRYGGADGPEIAADDLRGEVYRNAPTTLDDRVVDLSGVLDGKDQPFMSDATNHNEVAARLIAAAMWKELRPQVLDLSTS